MIGLRAETCLQILDEERPANVSVLLMLEQYMLFQEDLEKLDVSCRCLSSTSTRCLDTVCELAVHIPNMEQCKGDEHLHESRGPTLRVREALPLLGDKLLREEALASQELIHNHNHQRDFVARG